MRRHIDRKQKEVEEAKGSRGSKRKQRR